MENILDHLYTATTYDKQNPVEFTYKMSANEIEELVKLRASNQYLFSGRRNAAKYAWRAILKHMGLQGAVTYSQASKKWDNMKKKYKDLKYPPEGVRVWPDQWPYFSLMNDAVEGRLAGSAPILPAQTPGLGEQDFLPASRPKKRVLLRPARQAASRSGMEVVMGGEEEEEEEMDQEVEEVENERALLEKERGMLESDREVLERERQVLERERAGAEREMAALERDRACLERERAAMERERAVMERERGMMERDRAALGRERRALEREREGAEVEKEKTAPENGTEKRGRKMDPEGLERREQFLNLFDKLIQTL